MNAHQRRKFMAHKHSYLPLGSDVVVTSYSRHPADSRIAKVFKHWKERPNVCDVQFSDGEVRSVTLHRIKPVLQLKVRPWWRVQNDEARKVNKAVGAT